jgi:hypothetical protein
MSVSSHDAFPEIPGPLLRLDNPADAVADPTEDLAEETTSELGSTATKRAEPPAASGVEDDGRPGGAAPWMPGHVLRERYVLEAQLGSGGMAVVYRAVDLRRDAGTPDGRHVAIKLLRPELRDRPECIARLQREFRQTQAIAHPNVVHFHDLDCEHGAWFIVMELLSGEMLGPRLRRVAPSGLAQAEALAIAAAIGDGLAHAHACDVIHGDVKPDNICLPASGPPRLFDFGVAPDASPSGGPGQAESPHSAAATRAYASPEILAGEVPLPADDVFSLACVAYEMLAGVHPYRRQGGDVPARTVHPPPPILSLDAAASAALAAGLDLRRSARPSMAQLAAAFRGDMRHTRTALPEPAATIAPAAAAVADSPAATPRRPRVLLWGAVAAALAVALALGILIGRGESEFAPVTDVAAARRGDAATTATPASQAAPPSAPIGPRPATTKLASAMAETARLSTADAAQLGLVSFDSPMMVVSKRAVFAAIPLRHYSRVRRATQVTWRVVDGTARAGRDYGGPETGVENFVEGNTFRILYVPILPEARTELDRSFAIELTGATPGTELGPTQRIEVTILGTA